MKVVKTNKLLIVVDMQEGFRYKNVEKIIPNLQKLISNFDGKIIFTYFKNNQNSFFEKQLKWKRFQSKKDQQILKELVGVKHKKLWHSSYSILNKQLKDYLIKNNIQEVYLAGIYLDVCIAKLAMDLFDNEYKSFIVSNSVTTQNGRDRRVFLTSLKRVIDSKSVI